MVRRSLLSLLLAVGVSGATTRPVAGPQAVGEIEGWAIGESSGVVESRSKKGVYWTINDSGNRPVLFAIDRSGKTLGAFAVDAPNHDWEDIAADGQGRLYIADIGNNEGERDEVQVYRVAEPGLADGGKEVQPGGLWRVGYPGEPFDAEALFVHGEQMYVIEKRRDGELAGLYSASLGEERPTLRKVGSLPIYMPVTGADLSRDGRELAVVTVGGVYRFVVDGEPAKAVGATPTFAGYVDIKMEACCFTEGGVLTTSETRQMLLFPDAAFREVKPGEAGE